MKKRRLLYFFREKELEVLLALCSEQSLDSFEDGRFKKLRYTLLLLIGWPLYQFHWSYFSFVMIASFLIYKQPYFLLARKKTKQMQQLKYEFPIWLRQLQILLQNNTVLNALQVSYGSAPTILKEPLQVLIKEIAADPISIAPYLRFMSEFEIYEIQKAMKLLYRYHFVGAEESYQQFQRMIEATSKWLRQARNEKKANAMYRLQWLGMLPLFGVTLMFLVMMVVVILAMMKGEI